MTGGCHKEVTLPKVYINGALKPTCYPSLPAGPFLLPRPLPVTLFVAGVASQAGHVLIGQDEPYCPDLGRFNLYVNQLGECISVIRK